MKILNKNIFKRLCFRLVSQALFVALLIGIGLYLFILSPVTASLEKHIQLELQEIANQIYGICDNKDMEVMRLGNITDDPAVKIIKGHTIGVIENMMSRNDINIFIKHKNAFILKPKNISVNQLKQIKKLHVLQNNFFLTQNGNKHYFQIIDFNPWNWQIYILKNEESYALLTNTTKKFYKVSTLLLIVALVTLIFYLYCSINKPVQHIIYALKHGNKPDYKGIAEFEFLSENLRYSLEQNEDKNLQLKKLNIELDNEIYRYKQAVKKLKTSQENYRELVQNANSIILRLDINGHITFFNEYAQNFFGFSKSEILGRHVIGTIVPETESTGRDLKPLLDDLCKNPKKYEYNINENIRKNGERVWIAWTNKVLTDKKGTPYGALSIGSDITQRKELEKRLQEAKRMEAIGTLAGGIAHDFNNNLAAIIGYAELAQDDIEIDHPANLQITEVINAGLRAKELVCKILAFSRHTSLGLKETTVKSIAEDAVKMLQETLPHSIQLKININPCSCKIMADAPLLNQMIMNLFNNAIQEMNKMGVVLTFSLDCVDLTPNCSIKSNLNLPVGSYVKISVSDTGEGISSENIDRLFEPFFTTKEVGEGSGMGLAVVHGIVKSHGGAISVNTSPDKGTTFDTFLPRSDEKSAS